MARTQDGQPLKMLMVGDEYTRKCLAIAVERRLKSREVQEVWSGLSLLRGRPTHKRRRVYRAYPTRMASRTLRCTLVH